MLPLSLNSRSLIRFRHCPHCHGRYHWYLRSGRLRPGRQRPYPEAPSVHWVHSTWCWSRCRSGRSRCWVCIPFSDLSGLWLVCALTPSSFAIGIVGDAGVRGTAQQPRLYVGMILILIFAEVLGKILPQCSSHCLVILTRLFSRRSLRLDCRSAHELPLKGRLLSKKRIVALGNWALCLPTVWDMGLHTSFSGVPFLSNPIHIKHVFSMPC